jgi:3-hydroxyisobutyrate dehydrogenase
VIGIGRMGHPIARRLLAAGHAVGVWNRPPGPAEALIAAGAKAYAEVGQLVAACDAVLLILADAAAADSVLGREGDRLAIDVAKCLVIQLGTTHPDHSSALGEAIANNGGRYVEAPVSGSRVPAEQGRLVAMLGGYREEDLDEAEAILSCLTVSRFRIGSPPMAMKLKLAVNAYLVPLVTALAEAWKLAEALDLDPQIFAEVLNQGPMASDVSRVKLDKLLDGDWSAQASIDDVLMNARLIGAVAREAGVATSLVSSSEELLKAARQYGNGVLDMVAVCERPV